MSQLKFSCPCLLGIEGLVADELRNMDAKNVQAENGRVLFEGNYEILARANICSRFSERVQILVGEFNARTFDELFEGVKALPWENFIGKNDSFPVKGSSLNSKLASIPDCQAIIKKAIVERLKRKYKITWFEESEALFQIQFRIMKDKVSVMIDTSGAGLHKRGYRKNANGAPIKETLAASMAKIARVKENSFVVDPFCGSGTILIEAAMLALNIAPGLKRKFISQDWKAIPKMVWNQERERAISHIKKDACFRAIGYDIDQESVYLSRENAKKAGVEKRVTIEKRDIRNFKETAEKATIICNPPYGERLLDVNKAEQIYKTMGNVFRTFNNYNYYIISPDENFEKCFNKKADKRRKLYNGMIKCQLYMYFK